MSDPATTTARPVRQAGLACKRRLREQLGRTGSHKRPRAGPTPPTPPHPCGPPRPTVLNDRDAITLDDVDPWAATTFLARADPDGATARAYEAAGLFRYCVESVNAPHDPVSMRPFDKGECAELERAAGEPAGAIAQGREAAQAAREADRSGGDLSSSDNQEAMLGVLMDTIQDATREACESGIEDTLEMAVFLAAEFRPTVGSIVGVLEINHQILSQVQDALDEAFGEASRLAGTRPQAPALVMTMSDMVLSVVRDRVSAQVARARTAL